jgi:hypothetical protein
MKRIMKKILKYSLLAVLGFVLAANTGCKKSELDTNQFNGFSLAAVAPNPVMRGGELSLVGAGLENVSEVQFAGNVTITDITVVAKGAQSEIRVMVPLEGPEVGKVTVVAKDGRKASTRFDLTYTEPIVIESFTPTVALSGDVLTFKGEYLNDVKTVIFGGDVMVTEFKNQSRHELKVAVPATALTGPVILSDVDEITDQSTIPNHIYTAEDLVIGEPVVRSFPAAKTAKAGDVINVTGEHLDMIETVDLPNAEGIVFEVNELGTLLNFTMPAKARSGELVVTTYDGDVIEVGEIDAVVVDFLSIKTLAEDKRFKAGCETEITGTDLDLVTEVSFPNADLVVWDYDKETGSIFATLPADARDGVVTVTLESGVQFSTDAIEVVKPEILAWEHFDTYVAGETVVTVDGTDLDLVDTVLMGDDKQGYFECYHDYDAENGTVKVTIPEEAYTSPIIFISAADYITQTDPLEVSYKLPVSITFDAPSFALGKKISLTGEHLLKIEQVYIKGKKVTSFDVRTDNAMVFAMPEEITSPGVCRLELVLTDGSKLTWPVPFEITAPYTETFIWEGSQIINGWSGVTFGDNRFIWSELGIKEGDVVKLYFTAPETGWWDLQLVNGHWGNLSIDELGGGNEIKQDAGFPGGAQTFSFNVTASVLASLTEDVGWGGAFIINGDGNVEVTGISLIQFGAVGETIWEGSVTIDWGGSTPGASGAMSDLSWGGYAAVKDYFVEGAVMELKFERLADEVQIRLGNGSWSALPGTQDPYKLKDGETNLEVELTQAMVDELNSAGGLVITGQGYTLTEVVIK